MYLQDIAFFNTPKYYYCTLFLLSQIAFSLRIHIYKSLAFCHLNKRHNAAYQYVMIAVECEKGLQVLHSGNAVMVYVIYNSL